MTVYQSRLSRTLDGPWLQVSPIPVGRVSQHGPTPDIYLLIEQDDKPLLRVDVYSSQLGPFTDITNWGRWIVLGIGNNVHLIDPRARETRTIDCDGYFGHLYSSADKLFIATASQLICLDQNGEQIWRCPDLAADGVVVETLGPRVLQGHGEWHPPNGWQPFRVDTVTGQQLSE